MAGTAEQRLSQAEISMILDTYMYMNYQEAVEGATLREVIADLESHPDYGGGGIHCGEYQVLKEAAEYEQVGSLTVNCQSADMGYDSGTAAVTFVSEEENTVYVVYRGTGDGEWPDNGLGMTEAATTQQNRALDYFEEAAERLGLQREWQVIVTGHSKGGNKAQFVTMETTRPQLIDTCYSVDGQGFSEKAVEGWKSRYGEREYAARTGKIYGIHGENDYVSALGNSIIPGEHISYVRTPVEKTNFAGYHDIKYMFASREYDPERGEDITVFHGRKNPDVWKRGELGNYAAALSEGMMALEEERLDGCAAVIMQLMEMTGGRKDGINGEKLDFSDLADFTLQGIPLITASFVEQREGRELLSALFGKKGTDQGLQPKPEIRVAQKELEDASERLLETADKLNDRIQEILLAAKSIPVFMKGSGVWYFRIRRIAGEMQEQTDRLRRTASLEKQAAILYREWQGTALLDKIPENS